MAYFFKIIKSIIIGEKYMQVKILTLFILSAFFGIFVFFNPALADLEQQRQDFLAAEGALKTGRVQEFNQLISKLTDYPLYPYLLYEQIRRDISSKHEDRILWFLDEYSSTPLADRLRQQWLEYLAGKSSWQKLVRDYRGPYTQSLQCSYARALMENGQTEKAWEEAEKLWLHGRSRPKECDPVFHGWRSHGRLTKSLVWQRIELAIDQGQTALAGYLKRYLPEDDQPWLDLWLEVINRPLKTIEINWSEKDHPVAEKILSRGMGILIRGDTQEALKQWEGLQAKHDLKSMDTSLVKRELAVYLALRKHPETLEYIRSLCAETMTPSLRQWQVRNALYQKNWQEAMLALEKMDDSEKNLPRWIYWQARIHEEMGLEHEARTLYQSILGRQNYFSLLASDRLNQPYIFQNRPISSYEQDRINLRQDQGIMRSLELFYLDRMVDARREWNTSMSGKSREESRAAALLAHELGWHDRAIIAAAGAGEFDDLVLRFPVSHYQMITDYSRARDLNPAWVFALARQESMFMPDVRSPAGALGIMQIMPATGRLIASLMGETLTNTNRLLNPEINVRFGTFYLKKRLDEFQNSPVLATAAYNAGALRVSSWLPEQETIAADIWVENIPFFETRDYVEKIFTYKAIYEKRLGVQPTRISGLMPDVLGKNTVSARVEFH
jgi:soluble lytic murein transglycosylase